MCPRAHTQYIKLQTNNGQIRHRRNATERKARIGGIVAVVLKYKLLSLAAEVNPSPQPPPLSVSVLNNYDIITALCTTATLPWVAKNKVGQTKKGDLNYKTTWDVPATFVASQTVINHAWRLPAFPVGLLFRERAQGSSSFTCYSSVEHRRLVWFGKCAEAENLYLKIKE